MKPEASQGFLISWFPGDSRDSKNHSKYFDPIGRKKIFRLTIGAKYIKNIFALYNNVQNPGSI